MKYLIVIFGLIMFSCGVNDSPRKIVDQHMKPICITGQENVLIRVTDPNNMTYFIDNGIILINDPVEGNYLVHCVVNKICNEIVPGEKIISTMGIRINGSIEEWIPIDEFGVPVIWTYGPYSFEILVSDGRNVGSGV